MIQEIWLGDCLELMKNIPDKSVDLILCSPPYAEQRKKQYGGIEEKEYPVWTANWMEQVKRVLSDKSSVIINIRPNLKDGQISDYVLKTRLYLRECGWTENEELIWIKRDSPPLGSINRPRRSWESLLWFSLSGKPKCYPKANGTYSKTLFNGGNKGVGDYISSQTSFKTDGVARCRDFVEVNIGLNDKSKNNIHPAQYPVALCEWIIKLFTLENEVVLDPFIGSGNTALAAKNLNRQFIGIEKEENYYNICLERLK